MRSANKYPLKRCMLFLNPLGQKRPEAADVAAKTGILVLPAPQIPVSNTLNKLNIRSAINKLWSSQWVNRADCRQTKIWFLDIAHRKYLVIIQLQ